MLRSFLWKRTENEKSFLPVSWTKVCVPKGEGNSVYEGWETGTVHLCSAWFDKRKMSSYKEEA